MSSPRRLGLPESIRMRHDTHFVDQLARPSGEAIGRMIPIEDIEPNPRQPRQDLGDLSELTASVREKGILEPHPGPSRWRALRDHRRRASLSGRLATWASQSCPASFAIRVDAEMMELALIENLQRKDLTAFEEADGLQSLGREAGYTHEMMAEKLGQEPDLHHGNALLDAMPEDVRQLCRLADITSKSMLLQIARQGSEEAMSALIDKISGEGITREEARRFNRTSEKRPRRAKQLVFRFKPSDRVYQFSLTFAKPQVERDELIHALREILGTLVENPEALLSGHAPKLAPGAPSAASSPAGDQPTWP